MSYEEMVNDRALIEFLTAHKIEIEKICHNYANQSTDRAVEWKDFRQDAVWALCESWKDNRKLVERIYKTMVTNVCRDIIRDQKAQKRAQKRVVGYNPVFNITYVSEDELKGGK